MFLTIKNIREIIRILMESTVEEIEVNTWSKSIRVVRNLRDAPQIIADNQPIAQESKLKKIVQNFLDYLKQKCKKSKKIRSMHAGIIHLAPSQNSPDDKLIPLQVGEQIKKGQALAAVKTSKLMLTINSRIDGKIIEIRFKEGQKVRLAQILFIIDPN